ncbi:MAG: penicillin-binding transpeptidase domain-containing protein [Planctomycetes bacterium]|nr:penicillin-binding transpeptidase domain-containing protein [Planctomycetota bacterium]
METKRLFETGTRRVWWVLLPVALGFLAIEARLFDLQILRGAEHEAMARDNCVSIRLIQPLRGRILDARGRVLAEDRPVWGVAVQFGDVVSREDLHERVAARMGAEPRSVARVVGAGWGEALSPAVREVRREALEGLLARLAKALGRDPAALRDAVRRAEDRVLEREIQERARVTGLLLESEALSRREVRSAVRESERAILEGMRAAVPEGEYLLATGLRWDLEREARRRRWEAVEAVAERAGRRPRDLRKRIEELDQGCAARIIRSLRGEDHLLAEGGIAYAAVAAVEMDGDLYTGASVQARAGRVYPRGPDACHLLGTVGFLGWETRGEETVDLYEEKEEAGFFREPLSAFLDREDYEAIEARGEFRRDLFGKSGAEQAWDGELRGRRGARVVERDRRNRVQRDLEVVPPVHGGDVLLTVDAALQAAAREAFAAASDALPAGHPVRGAAAVLDPRTGAVLALVSVPGYDPNLLVPPVAKGDLDALLGDPGLPLLHRAIAGLYPPGSTFKTVSALAALEEGLLRADDLVECDGVHEAGRGLRFRCTARMGHGPLPLAGALERSCNCYFYAAGEDLGPALRRWAEAWGFGAPSGLDLPGERAGFLPRGRGPDWIQMAIGQRMTATPLQVARLMATIANGGRPVTPHVRRGAAWPLDGQVPAVSAAALEAVREGLRRVVAGEHGTAQLPALQEARAAGKTGTAQTGRIVNGQETNDAWFAGYAPFDAPRVALAVVVEGVPDGSHGGEVAGPVAGRIFEAALRILADADGSRIPEPRSR